MHPVLASELMHAHHQRLVHEGELSRPLRRRTRRLRLRWLLIGRRPSPVVPSAART
jgi:hypothetical protein